MTDPLLRSSGDSEIPAGAPVGQAGRNRLVTRLRILAAVLLVAAVAAALIGYRQSQKHRRDSLWRQAELSRNGPAAIRGDAAEALEKIKKEESSGGMKKQ